MVLLSLMVVGCSEKKTNNNDEILSDEDLLNSEDLLNDEEFLELKEERLEKEREYTKNIAYEAKRLEDGSLLVFIKNNNEDMGGVKVDVKFFDNAGNLVDTGKDRIEGINPGQEVIAQVRNISYDAETYEIVVTAITNYYISHLNEVNVTHNDTGEGIFIKIKNNSDVELDEISAVVLFYRNDEVVAAIKDEVLNLEPEKEFSVTVSYPRNEESENIDFDRYEVYLNAANEDKY